MQKCRQNMEEKIWGPSEEPEWLSDLVSTPSKSLSGQDRADIFPNPKLQDTSPGRVLTSWKDPSASTGIWVLLLPFPPRNPTLKGCAGGLLLGRKRKPFALPPNKLLLWWAREMAQSIKCLSCKHEGLGLEPDSHVKSPSVVVHAWGSLASQSA